MSVFDALVAGLKRCIPVSSLPMNVPSHEDLAAALANELSGSVSLIDKHEYDRLVRLSNWVDKLPEE